MASIYKRGKVWWINWKNSCGHRSCESLKTHDGTMAKRLKKQYEIEERKTQLSGVTTRTVLLESFIDEYLRIRKGQIAQTTIIRYRQALQSLSAHIGNIQLARISPSDIENWRQSYSQTRTPASSNCLLRHIKAALNYAVEHRYIVESPGRYVRPIREIGKPLRILTQQEVGTLLEGVSPELEELIRIALLTGGRAGELCRLKPEDFDSSIPAITIKSTATSPTKSKNSRMVPVPASSVEFFEDLQHKAKTDYLLADPNGLQWSVDKIGGYFRRLTKKKGLSCTFHDLRRTYGAWLVMAGVDLVTVQLNLGHSDISVTVKHYAQVADSHRVDQVNRLPLI